MTPERDWLAVTPAGAREIERSKLQHQVNVEYHSLPGRRIGFKITDQEAAWIVVAWAQKEIPYKEIEGLVDIDPTRACNAVRRFCERWGEMVSDPPYVYGNDRRDAALRALKKWSLANPELEPSPPRVAYDLIWPPSIAIQEHAFLLRCEGLKLREIAGRIDLSVERTRQMIRLFGRKVEKSAKKAHWRFQA